MGMRRGWKLIVFLASFFLLIYLLPLNGIVLADYLLPITDQTSLSPLSAPDPVVSNPRYISGVGLDNSYFIFYEDRSQTVGCVPGTYRIFTNQTTGGALGFSNNSTATNICDSHFLVKDWPITIAGNTYNYRGWGAGSYTGMHNFYVSTDRLNWTLITTFTFNHPSDGILYGFHDVYRINNKFIGLVESAGGHTYFAISNNGDDFWTVGERLGGIGVTDRLRLPGPSGPIPSGNFSLALLDGQLTYVKLYVPGNRSAAYLMINSTAALASNPAAVETAFIDPINWSWRDGSIGLPGGNNVVLISTLGSGGHDVRETWTIPISDPRSNQVILYTASYAGSVSRGIGCAAASSACSVDPFVPPIVDQEDQRSKPDIAKGAFLIPVTGYSPRSATQKLAVDQFYDLAKDEIRLEIPKMGLSIPIVGAPLQKRHWELDGLGNQAAYLEGTAFPTWKGNSVLAGHVIGPDGLEGPFSNLSLLQYGDNIIIRAWGNIYLYEVRDYRLVAPTDQYAFKSEEYSWITLTTCYGYDEVSQTYTLRRVVKALSLGFAGGR